MFFKKILNYIFQNSEKKKLKRHYKIVAQINTLENELCDLSDNDLRELHEKLKQKVQIEKQSLDSILPESFALVREASKRTLKLRHYDVQLIGGIVLHEGKIAEMKTGEGKTLVATLAACLNALTGQGVHIVTVNDYLAKRDAEWMRPIYEFFNLKVAWIQNQDSNKVRKEAYAADITYITNNELGFDYLRDNMVGNIEDKVQRILNFAIIDEVDSILIDEARTPLIISGSTEDSIEMYYKINDMVQKLTPASKKDKDWDEESGDYKYEFKEFNVILTEKGIQKIENYLSIDNLYDPQHVQILHHIHQSLKAQVLYQKDKDYIVENNKIIIIDEHTGRKMIGRRYSDGLHQAIEAKESVQIQRESQTLATITFQNYFSLYQKKSGMTGTAKTEAEEFQKIYKLEVITIPTHLQMIRKDFPDQIYQSLEDKLAAIIHEIENAYKKGQAVLVGTISIEKNEMISRLLKKRHIPHAILNAKFHEMEAKIISNAGKKHAVTIATNMAGRGTDIKIDPEVFELGGLYIIGTERHESRRIDNQLRGRSGRQGDPGASRFFLSLEDSLMKLFGSDKLASFMEKMGFEKGEKIEHRWITKAIANAQKRVEAKNFEIRKYLLEYDNVVNIQRTFFYKLRKQFLQKENIDSFIQENLKLLIQQYMLDVMGGKPIKLLYEASITKILHYIQDVMEIQNLFSEELYIQSSYWDAFIDTICAYLFKKYKQNFENIYSKINNPNEVNSIICMICLNIIDSKWKDHLHNLDNLKEGIHLQSYADKNPLVEYKIEAFYLFENFKFHIFESILQFIYRFEFHHKPNTPIPYSPVNSVTANSISELTLEKPKNDLFYPQNKPYVTPAAHQTKIRRNDACYCGSNKKYKKCCGK